MRKDFPIRKLSRDDPDKHAEAVAYWRKVSPEEKMRTVGELITAAYALKGIDVTEQRLPRSRRDPADS